MIPVERLQYLPQAFVAVVLLVPHVLVILDFSILIQSQDDQTVDRFAGVQDARRVFLLLLVDDLGGRGFEDLGLEGFGRSHDFGKAWKGIGETGIVSTRSSLHTIPLSSDLVSRITVTPWIVVDGFLRVHFHVLFTRAPTVEIRNRLDYPLVFWRDRYGLLRVWLIINISLGVLGRIRRIVCEGLRIRTDLVLVLKNLARRHGGG